MGVLFEALDLMEGSGVLKSLVWGIYFPIFLITSSDSAERVWKFLTNFTKFQDYQVRCVRDYKG